MGNGNVKIHVELLWVLPDTSDAVNNFFNNRLLGQREINYGQCIISCVEYLLKSQICFLNIP